MTGADLKRQREQLGLSQAELAELFGCARTTIWRWERGDMPIEHPGMVWLACIGIQHTVRLGETPATNSRVSRTPHNP